jgi:hypothetical protein
MGRSNSWVRAQRINANCAASWQRGAQAASKASLVEPRYAGFPSIAASANTLAAAAAAAADTYPFHSPENRVL